MDRNNLARSTRFLLVATFVCWATSTVDAAEINDRMSLVEAIESVREQGYDVSYSSMLVKPWMRVRVTPAKPDPLIALQQVIAEYNLMLEEAAGHRWLIVSGEQPDKTRTYSIRGRVTDAATGESINNARIRAGDHRARSTSDGKFEIPGLPTESAVIIVSADGYVGVERKIVDVSELTVLDVTLEPVQVPRVEEITIVASRYSIFSRDGTSSQFLTGDDIRLMPHIADDAFRVLHKLPGVAANDFQAPFNLRGGTIDEVKVVLDGLELFEPYHMRTLFSPLSIIDPGIIGQAQVLSGGFTAEYGNHMSGVVDITSIWPSGEPVHQLGVSFVSSFARSSGAFSENRGSYQLSVRRGYLDLITDAVTDEGEELSPRYSDVFARLNYELNDSVSLAANVLSASDDVDFVDPFDGEDFSGESSLNYAWLTINTEPSESFNFTNTFFAGRVEITEDGVLIDTPFESVDKFFRRDIEVAGMQSDLIWRMNDRAMWKAGIRYRSLTADYDYHIDSLRQTDITNDGLPYTLIRDIVTSRDGDEYGAYAAFRFQTLNRLTWELGLRWDKQTYTNTIDDTQLSPRINGFYRLDDRTEIRLGWGNYHQPQGIQDLQVQDGETIFHPAQKAEHRVLGIRHRRESGLEMQADIYEKRYSDVRPRFENALDIYDFPPESNFDRVRIAPDSAKSRGIEVTLRNRRSERLHWWLNYTWSKAEDVINGTSIPRSWDQTHAATASLAWKGDKWNLNAIASYHSGWPRTRLLLLPNFDSLGNFTGANSDLSQRNLNDFDAYTRVDLRLSRTISLKKSNFEYYFEIFNVFDTVNECCVESHNLQFGPPFAASPRIDDFLPFFPSFGFVWTFGPGVDKG